MSGCDGNDSRYHDGRCDDGYNSFHFSPPLVSGEKAFVCLLFLTALTPGSCERSKKKLSVGRYQFLDLILIGVFVEILI